MVTCDGGVTLTPVSGVHPHHIKPAGSADDPQVVEVPGAKLPQNVEPGEATPVDGTPVVVGDSGVTQAR
ncbi:hypothetical protein [Streptomyces sp. NPDC101234]|uniref:hypothetical protein n=1 Tax=Streptomyces sp. NPDC101234 TaxID=3366138 RepID=UPI00380FCCAC